MRVVIAIVLVALCTQQAAAQTTPEPGVLFHEKFDDFTEEDQSLVIVFPSKGDFYLTWGCGGPFGLGSSLIHNRLRGDSDQKVTVQYKFDNGELSSLLSRYLNSTGNATTVFEGPKGPFINQALSSNGVTIRITDLYDYSEMTASFPLDGLANALKKLKCY